MTVDLNEAQRIKVAMGECVNDSPLLGEQTITPSESPTPMSTPSHSPTVTKVPNVSPVHPIVHLGLSESPHLVLHTHIRFQQQTHIIEGGGNGEDS